MKNCDILVVGGGGGALRAAIAAKETNPNLKVVLATKGILGKSGVTATACSDRMAFHATLDHTEPNTADAWRLHADDIYRIGGKVSDYDLAEVLARNGKDAFGYLDHLAVPFVKKNGLADQFVTDGSEYARACYTGPRTAVHIEQALLKRFEELEIELLEHCMVTRLVVKDGKIVGAIAVSTAAKELQDGDVLTIAAPAVILATGGAGLVFEHNVFPGGMTGDGMSMAFDIGAELVNMEFIQMGIASVKTKFNCSGSMMRALPRLVNEQGEEILDKYFPAGTTKEEIFNVVFKKGASWPVSYEHKTHIIDIALYKEKKAGHKVFLDFSRNPDGFWFGLLTEENQLRYEKEKTADLGALRRGQAPLERLREINQASIDWFLEHGIDLVKGEQIEVAACAQHYQGGIKIDSQGRTTVEGLWAVGEAAGGQHGANRPGGNALLDCQVFGKIAGEDAAAEAVRHSGFPAAQELDDARQALLAEFNRHKTGKPVFQVRSELQRIMENGAGIVRTESGLTESLSAFRQLKNESVAIDKVSPAFLLETKHMLTIGEIVLLAAKERDESRGPHLRFKNYADNVPVMRRDDCWEQYIVVRKSGGQAVLDIRKPVQPIED